MTPKQEQELDLHIRSIVADTTWMWDNHRSSTVIDEQTEKIKALFKDQAAQIAKAYGNCTNCYGKGYHTTIDYTHGSADFIGDKAFTDRNQIMRYCTCDRGKQLEQLHNQKKGTSQ